MEHPITPSPSQPISLFSDDEDCCIAGGDENHSPWQRMRWTDESVRLLISLVAASIDESDRKQSPALQRKGKWKLVSKSMTQKGCYVSPQQCEDKFNDLNKRYKRLNEILGRGTSCQVVENPALLDSMPHVSQKAKDDVRRILGSKHLFYREMCAYHNGQKIPDPKACGEARVVDDDEEEDEEEDDDEEDCFRNDDFCKMNRDKLRAEIDAVFRDSTKSQCERRVWIRKQLLQLQQERVGIHADAFELEKREMKWKRFCGKKDREFASLRMENERLRLENERMTLHVRHKEMEFDMARQGEMIELSCGQVEGERVRTQTGVGRLQ